MKNSMIHVLFLMVAFVSLFGGIAISVIGAHSSTLALIIGLTTTMLAIMICLDIGKLRQEA